MSALVLEAFQKFEPRADVAWMLQDAAYRERLQLQAALFPAYALPDSRSPSCLFGIVDQFGVGEGWMLPGLNFNRDVKKILPLMRYLTAYIYAQRKLHRLHMFVDSSRRESATWAKHMGFRKEHGPIVQMGPRREDLDLWVYEYQQAKRGN